jgi:quercetin dioxygenase-like cupin family protein
MREISRREEGSGATELQDCIAGCGLPNPAPAAKILAIKIRAGLDYSPAAREDIMTTHLHARRAWLLVAMLALSFGTAGTAGAVELDPAALVYKLPDQLKWRDPTGAAGVNQAILHGDPTKPGLYVVLNRFKPGNFSRPHFHPNDRFITVVKGTWWVATGNKFDPNNTVPMPAGSFVTHFAKQVHWDGAKDEEAWVLITGEGPATLTRVEEAQ